MVRQLAQQPVQSGSEIRSTLGRAELGRDDDRVLRCCRALRYGSKEFLSKEAGQIRLMRLVLLTLTAFLILRAHDPISTKLTWTQEVSRIVYKRCAGCHREG